MRIPYIIVGCASSIITASYIMYAIWARYHRIAVLNDTEDIQGNFLIGLTICAGLIAIPVGFGLGMALYSIAYRLWETLRFQMFSGRTTHKRKSQSWISPFVDDKSTKD
ncbi:MAG: hypothetical protein CL707_03455 [Chloroflexi bacterium]|nr:hypothetical protein [Chloroflexota bacterium]